MHARNRLMVFVSILACALMLSGTAFAGTARQGDDYSYTYNQNKQAVVCDMERDWTNAYTKFQRFGSGYNYRVYDKNGASPGCYVSKWGRVGISQHATCEDRRFWPDPCITSYH